MVSPLPRAHTTTTHYPSWGSGTSRASGATWRCAPSHYPSWRSGTRDCQAPPLSPWDSLPLMGIGNWSSTMSPSPCFWSSLPLMGIGNDGIPGVLDSERILITPHGDREPRARRARESPDAVLITPHGDRERFPQHCQVAAYLSLITPHGDRELGIGGGGGAGSFDSLPLMGIGNISPRERMSTHSPASHYPSWGSGTSSFPFQHKQAASLITPHGDREPSIRSVSISPVNTSLPLMGIGNVVAIGPVGAVDVLITPHGDREPLDASRSLIAISSSLPLMGIGNPHAGAPAGAPSPPSHYPSWGSGTAIGGCGQPLVRPSLPLMGIGNASRNRNKLVTWNLITPHGDREPDAR